VPSDLVSFSGVCLAREVGRGELRRKCPDVLRTRVFEYVRTHLAEPDLTHASVAAAHHISVRTVLLDPRRRKAGDAGGFAHAYTEQSHFTPAFKHSGVTPAALRRAHGSGDR